MFRKTMNAREYCGLVGTGNERKTKRGEGKGKYADAIERNSRKIHYNENRQKELMENKGVCPYRYQDTPMFSASSRTLQQIWDEEDKIANFLTQKKEESEAKQQQLKMKKENAKVHLEEEEEESATEEESEHEKDDVEEPPLKKAKTEEEQKEEEE